MTIPLLNKKVVFGETKRKTKLVSFELDAPEAQQVFLAGEFNSWDPKSLPMKKNKDGKWSTKVNLCSGDYEYKFIKDNNWITDPANDKTKVVKTGLVNSVKKVVL